MTSNDQKLRRGLALASVVGALAAPAASAAPVQPVDRNVDDFPGGPVRVIESETESGFDWGDAGIGAAAVLALGAIGAGAALASGRMQRQPAAAQRVR
jgi:hypothetical protein